MPQSSPHHFLQQLPHRLPHHLAYMAPRAVLVLLGWGMTYCLLTALSTRLPPALVYVTGILWMLAGAAGFGYLYRLRREAEFAQGRSVGTQHKPT